MIVDYMRIVQEVEQDLHPKLLLLGELSIFVKEKELFSKVSPLMKVQYIQRGETIVSEGDKAERMFWIISGECTVSKIVPFVSISIHGTFYSMIFLFIISRFQQRQDRKIHS